MFGFEKNSIVGIDVGASAIKAVELSIGESSVTLRNFSEVSLKKIEDGLPADAERSFGDEVTLRIRALFHKMQPDTGSVAVSLPAYMGLVVLIELPYLEKDELASAVQFEARKYIPSKPEDVLLSWDILEALPPSPTVPGGHMRILLAAALKNEVQKYESYITGAGASIVFEELETFSLARALTHGKPGTQMIIDIGSKATNCIVVQNGQVQASSGISIGSKDFTRTLSELMGVAPERAEDMKKSGTDYLNASETSIQFPALDAIVSECQHLQALAAQKNPATQCSEYILSGGGAQLTGIEKFLEKQLGAPVSMSDPWRGIKLPPGFKRDLYFDTQFSVALGVALGVHESRSKKNVQKESSFSGIWNKLNKKI
jgi:type IV pilus assembly protein PilM